MPIARGGSKSNPPICIYRVNMELFVGGLRVSVCKTATPCHRLGLCGGLFSYRLSCQDREPRLLFASESGRGGSFAHVYRDEIYSLQIVLSRTQARPGRTVKQGQEEISPNHVRRINLISVLIYGGWV